MTADKTGAAPGVQALPGFLRDRFRKHLVAKILSIMGLVLLAGSYWADRVVGTLLGQELWLADVVPVALAIPFGIWRFTREDSRYQRVRVGVILGTYLVLWAAIPMLLRTNVPRLGGTPEAFPAIHAIGSLTFFLYAFAMLLFGKRIDCGWNCPCVTMRETVGYAFRDNTVRGKFWWHLRWLKWVPGLLLVIYLALLIIRPNSADNIAGRPFYSYIANTYFYSFLFVPLLGNRSYCRWLCPYAAFWGWLSYGGAYRIKAAAESCTGCRSCELSCDMGVPIADLVARKGEVRTVECMGCSRCVEACPRGVLRIESAAKWWSRKKPILPATDRGADCPR
jgi:glutamate synthase (NADPH) small chain